MKIVSQAVELLNLNFCIVVGVSIVGGPFFAIGGDIEKTWPALFVSALLLFFVFGQYLAKRKKCNKKLIPIFFIFQCVCISLTFPAFYFGIAVIVNENNFPMHDEDILQIDQFILGWLFPKGQLSLWVDAHPYFNPSTFLGKLIVDFLQIIYVSYYFWGYFLMLYLIHQLILSWWKEKQDSQLLETKLKILMCAWAASYFLTFLGNLAFPGISPRIYLQNYYTHPLNGFGFSRLFTNNLKKVSTFATFPSGHVGEMFAVSFIAVRISPTYGRIATIASILMALATLWCRYHYFTDVICTIPLVILSLMFGMVLPNSCYQILISEATQIPKQPKLQKL